MHVDDDCVGTIGPGMLALIGVQPQDDRARAQRLLDRLLSYRIFADAQGRMNLSLRDHGGGLLLVSQFTLAADTSRGNRPGFSTAATPELARELFDYLLEQARLTHPHVASGRFGANMQVSLTNDGPVSFWLQA